MTPKRIELANQVGRAPRSSFPPYVCSFHLSLSFYPRQGGEPKVLRALSDSEPVALEGFLEEKAFGLG